MTDRKINKAPSTSLQIMPFEAVVKAANAHIAKGEQSFDKAEQYYKAAGLHITDAWLREKAKPKAERLAWDKFIPEHFVRGDGKPLGYRRAEDLMAIGAGRKTLLQLRAEDAQRKRVARKKSTGRPVENTVADAEDRDDEERDEREEASIATLAGLRDRATSIGHTFGRRGEWYCLFKDGSMVTRCDEIAGIEAHLDQIEGKQLVIIGDECLAHPLAMTGTNVAAVREYAQARKDEAHTKWLEADDASAFALAEFTAACEMWVPKLEAQHRHKARELVLRMTSTEMYGAPASLD